MMLKNHFIQSNLGYLPTKSDSYLVRIIFTIEIARDGSNRIPPRLTQNPPINTPSLLAPARARVACSAGPYRRWKSCLHPQIWRNTVFFHIFSAFFMKYLLEIHGKFQGKCRKHIFGPQWQLGSTDAHSSKARRCLSMRCGRPSCQGHRWRRKKAAEITRNSTSRRFKPAYLFGGNASNENSAISNCNPAARLPKENIKQLLCLVKFEDLSHSWRPLHTTTAVTDA